jgi:hydrophobe/amphiphile efflux-1 (HAE1) family protein
MQWLAHISVKRPIFASVIVLLIVVVGFASLKSLGVDRFPNVDLPVVTVTTVLPGAAPEDVEIEITDRIEAAVNTISGIEELRSTSSEGVSQVFITFNLDKDNDVAAQEVRDQLNMVIPNLPTGIELPTVQKFDPQAAPVLRVALEANRPIAEISEYADKKVRRQFEGIPGVGRVSLIGDLPRQINVIIDPLRLRAAGITATDVQRAIQAQNVTMPGGSVQAGPREMTLRVQGRVEDTAALGDIVIREVDGHPIRVANVARIEDGVAEPQSSALQNGTRTVVLSIIKQSGANTVALVDALKERMVDIKKTIPAGYKLTVVRDDSRVIRTSVNAVNEHLILGSILAALVVLLFLGNARSTIIAALAIPTSIIGTFTLMWLQGFTLNVITLLALALAVGIVIDDAIVVLENIYRYIEEKKYKPYEAAIAATKEIGLAVLATTLSLIVIFLPIAFLGGIPGRFLKSFGLTMAAAIAISLIVSFTLTPMLASRFLKANSESNVLTRMADRFYNPMASLYQRMLAFALRKRWIIVVASVFVFLTTVPLMALVPKGFLPLNEEAHLQVQVRAPEGTSLAQTELDTERLARKIRELPQVKATLTTVGDDSAATPNLGGIYVSLVDPADRKESQNEVMAIIRDQIIAKAPKTLRMTVGEVPAFSGGGFSTAQIQYVLAGPDLAEVERYARTILETLKKEPGAVDVDSTMISGKPEISVILDRDRAADLGVDVIDVTNTLRLLVGGVDVSTFEEKGEQYDIEVRAEPAYRADTVGLGIMTVPSKRLGSVPLDAVVKLEESTGASAINRLNRRRQVSLYANPAPGYAQSDIANKLLDIIKAQNLPSDYTVVPLGQTKEMGRVARSFLVSLLLAFIFMYLVLAAQFESWLHPITILLSLPLTLPFAFVSLLLLGQGLNIFTMLGILVLFGVVKKNAILQIDHTNQLREKGMSRHDALMQANQDRLRPILMTTFAFVAGMIPLALSTGVGAGFNRATAGVVIAGQLLSLLLTLLAIPVAYSLFDDASTKLRKRLRLTSSNEMPQAQVAHD